VRVYAVAPGFLPGGLNKGLPDAIIKFLGKKSGAGDSTPEDVADVVLKICTEPAFYASGSSISIPGGISPL
jgi:NAD(P)-dependent dehydrogenase (short-subunit alcohol dehydrogenase family)